MLKRMSMTTFTGTVLLVFNALVLIGWLTSTPLLISVFPAHIFLVFNSAFCFLLISLVLLTAHQSNRLQKTVQRTVGAALLFFGVITLFENALHVNIGIDHLFGAAVLDGYNPHPGRMGNNSALLFACIGTLFLLWNALLNKCVAVLLQITIGVTFIVGLFTTIGYILQLEFLYHSQSLLRLSLYGGMNFFVASLGLWSLARQTIPYSFSFFKQGREDNNIIFVSAVILLMIALVSELSGFSIFIHQNKLLLKDTMNDAVTLRVKTFQDDLIFAQSAVAELTSHPQLASIVTQSHPEKSLQLLLNSRGFTGVRVSTPKNKSLYQQGKFIPVKSGHDFIRLTNRQELRWQQGWYLHVELPLESHGQSVGWFAAEYPLLNVNRLYAQHDLGKSGEWMVCGNHDQANIICGPSSLDGTLKVEPRSFGEKYVSMNRALLGERGENTEIDEENDEVFTAFSPLGDSGLGVVVKMDTAELYVPVRSQLKTLIPVFILSVLAGLALLIWQVAPLLRKILISEKKALYSNACLRESESRFRSAFEMSAIGMALVSLDGKWLRVNSALCRILLYSEEEMLAFRFQELAYQDDLNNTIEQLQALERNAVQQVSIEKRFVTKEGYLLWTLLSASLIRDEKNHPLYFVFQIQDIDIQKKAEDHLKKMAYHDHLTELDNRSEIEKNIHSALFASRLNHQGFALLFLDLDHFKEVNDNYGHDVGDLLLQEVAKRLRASVRRTDKVGRLGGDEFVVILMGISDANAVSTIAKKIIETMAVPITIHSEVLQITTSVGVSIYPDDGLSMETLIKHADIALYCAKEFGKNNYKFFGGVGFQM